MNSKSKESQILDSLNESINLNESKWSGIDASTPTSKVKKYAQDLVNKAKKSNDSNQAWDVVDFLYDFPNALK